MAIWSNNLQTTTNDTTTASVNLSWQLLQTWLDRTVLENFEPNLRFYDMWEKPARPAGYNTLAWTRCNKLTVTPTNATLTEWVTPDDVAINFTTISLTANQYGMYAIISDILEDVSPVPMVANAAKVIWANMARIIDEVIQGVLALGTNVIFAGAATTRATIAATDLLTTTDLAKANAFLSTKAAPVFGDGYIAVMHPNVLFDLQTGTAAGAFVDLSKYTESGRAMIVNGEVGKIFNVRVVTSSYIQTFSSTVTVYPTYVMWKGAYWVADLQGLRSYMVGDGASKSDPLAQRRYVWAKVAFNAIILQQDALVRIESASSLSYTW